jgi:threonine dehydrogenase-like Zn-dependent dehydrogenase
MRAVCWHGKGDVRVEKVPDPKVLNPRDVIVRITSTAICGSDLHHYDGFLPGMQPGDIVGHEFMGEVVETGPGVRTLRPGDRVVASAVISCGNCYFCKNQLWSQCDNSNPNAAQAAKLFGSSPAAVYGMSHLFGGYAGGQAEYARVPLADTSTLKIDDDLPDEQVLFLSDLFPTGWMAAENADVQPGDTVAVFGCGPVGQFAIQSAYLLGADRVIAIDRIPERLEMAQRHGRADVINYTTGDVTEQLQSVTGGRGPDRCIDAVGMEAHGLTPGGLYDKVKAAVLLETERPTALRWAILACRKGGTVSAGGQYGALLDKVPLGAAFNKGLTIRTGPTPMQRYMRPLLERIQHGEIDPSFVITHRLPLFRAPQAYQMFRDKEDGCVKVVLTP